MIRYPMPPEPGLTATQAADRRGAALAVDCLANLSIAHTREDRTRVLLIIVGDLQREINPEAVAAGFARTLAFGLEIAMADEVHVSNGAVSSVSFGVTRQAGDAVKKKAARAVQVLNKGPKRGRR